MYFLPLLILLFPGVAVAEETIRATIVDIVAEEAVFLPGVGIESRIQILRARTDSGEYITLENDRVPLSVGQAFFFDALEAESGETLYTVREPDRRGALAFAVAFFAFVAIAVGRFVGFRALLSLSVSIALILFVLIPAVSSGAPAALVSIGISALVLAVAMAVTHGINRTTLAAFLGSIITIGIATALAHTFIIAAHLTGFADDTATILNLSTGGALNMQGVLLGAMVIGILGIIDDLAVTQVATVGALRAANPTLSKRELFSRASAVGREHFGAVVNTLFLAYAGASLPLLMLFTLSSASPGLLVNSEIIAIEIVRAAVGGAALALSLPLTTLLGVWLAPPRPPTHPLMLYWKYSVLLN